jgi:hypothetical protein
MIDGTVVHRAKQERPEVGDCRHARREDLHHHIGHHVGGIVRADEHGRVADQVVRVTPVRRLQSLSRHAHIHVTTCSSRTGDNTTEVRDDSLASCQLVT